MYANNLKKETNPNKKWIWSVRVSNTQPYLYLRHALPTELADHLLQMYSKLTILMQWMYETTWKEKLIQIKSEIWSVWISNTQPYLY